jgi:hypothetical protein
VGAWGRCEEAEEITSGRGRADMRELVLMVPRAITLGLALGH